jgi:murein DD-endopeptidase MepM/ murein hydrolase activator NlpD
MAGSYTVQRGDTMSSIAAKLGVTLAALEGANTQVPDFNKIFPGQVLNIPGAPSSGGGGSPTTSDYFVVVTIAGNIARRSNSGVTSAKTATGEYDVTFPEDVDSWLWQATPGAADSSPQTAGSVTTELGPMGANQVVHVRTFNVAAAAVTAADRPFHLSLHRVQ